MNLIAVEMSSGRMMIGIAVFASPSAMNVPRPESLMICPRAPPPPVTSIMIPADIIPFSISEIQVCLSRFLPSVKIATRSPSPTATIGCPRNISTSMNPAVLPSADAIVLIRIRMIGTIRGMNDSNVPGIPVRSIENAFS